MKRRSMEMILIAIMASLALASCGAEKASTVDEKVEVTTTTTTTVVEETTELETTTAAVETTAEPETTEAVEESIAETTTEQADPDSDLMTVEECVRKIVEDHTDAEIIVFQYTQGDRSITCVTSDGLRFVLQDEGSGVMDMHENGELTRISDYQILDPMEMRDGGVLYLIRYEPA